MQMDVEDFNDFFVDANNDDSSDLKTCISERYIQTFEPHHQNFENLSMSQSVLTMTLEDLIPL